MRRRQATNNLNFEVEMKDIDSTLVEENLQKQKEIFPLNTHQMIRKMILYFLFIVIY